MERHEMDEQKLEALRKYLNADCQAHLENSGRWWLDGGKLRAALEHAGIVEAAPPPPTKPKPKPRKAVILVEFKKDLPDDVDPEKCYTSGVLGIFDETGVWLGGANDMTSESIRWADLPTS
jgi:hypothetical protein